MSGVRQVRPGIAGLQGRGGDELLGAAGRDDLDVGAPVAQSAYKQRRFVRSDAAADAQ